MSELPDIDSTAEPRLSDTDSTADPRNVFRAKTHIERALENCDDEEVKYHLRETLHLLEATDEYDEQSS